MEGDIQYRCGCTRNHNCFHGTSRMARISFEYTDIVMIWVRSLDHELSDSDLFHSAQVRVHL
jgi:hypothetical protein